MGTVLRDPLPMELVPETELRLLRIEAARCTLAGMST
jgi:hypothetical protein